MFMFFWITHAVLAAWALTPDAAAFSPQDSDNEPDPKPRVVLPDESAFKPSKADGRGTVRVKPDVFKVSSPVTIEYEFTVASTGIAVGGGVTMSVSRFWFWTPAQTRWPDQPGYTTVKCSRNDVKLEVAADVANSVLVVRVAGDKPLAAADTLTIVYGDTQGGQHPTARGRSDRYAERGERFFFKVDGDGDGFFVPLENQAMFRVEAKEAGRLLAYAPAQATTGEPFEITIATVDQTYNRVESFVGTVNIEPVGDGVAVAKTARFDPGDRGAIRVRVTCSQDGVARLKVADPKGRLREAVTNPTVVAAAKHRRYTLYWGDLQIHSNLSDGTGSAEDIYDYARDVAGLDLAALTDHDHWGYRPLDTDPKTWQHILKVTADYHRPGSFVTFPAYEWTNWTYGHRHVLFRHEHEATIFSWQSPQSDHPEKLWKLLGDRDCMTISHHTGGGPMPTFWKYMNPKFETVVEVASVHGVSEVMGHPRCICSPVASGMVQSALARGYRLGMIGSGDAHDGHPGLGSPGRRAGLAGIYAKELTRDAIFEALRARRVYATTGCRAILRFHMGLAKMGSVAHLDDPNDERTFSLIVLGDAPIRSVTIVKNNEPKVTVPGTGAFATLEWTDTDPGSGGDYYYARIEQEDGEWIWSSPIWIE